MQHLDRVVDFMGQLRKGAKNIGFGDPDSLLPPSATALDLAQSGSSVQLLVLQKVPVLWMSAAPRDRFNDPRRSVPLNDECAEEAIKALTERKRSLEGFDEDEASITEKTHKELDGFWKKVEFCRGTRGNAYSPASGFYLDSLSADKHQEIVKASRKAGSGIPVPKEGTSAIIVCPESRAGDAGSIETTTLSPSAAADLAVARTTLHETGHGLYRTPRGRYDTAWGQLNEESLSEALSLRSFHDQSQLPFLYDFLSRSPIEYRSFIFCWEIWKKSIYNLIKPNG